MKLRTSFCNMGVIRKNITRFAPLWGIYMAGGLLVMLTVLGGSVPQSAAKYLSETIGPFSIINMIYAAICVQMLFGDLYNSRMCNALHATPLRRETWFFSHVVSGFLFSVVPHLAFTFLVAPLMQEMWFVAWFWLLGMLLEFVFFFGLAVFSAMCAGNRLAMAAVYGILNFASMIALWFLTTIYEPLIFGIAIPQDPFMDFCPVAKMTVNESLLVFERVADGRTSSSWMWEYQGLGDDWGYLILCTVLGIGFFALALVLYRKRKLECAGSFMAVKGLEPVFAVVFALCTGCVFAVVGQAFNGEYLIYLIVGLVIGWFAGQMLLRRTVKVFQWKTFGKLGILGLALGASLLLTWLDPIGITRWTPAPEKVEKVEISPGNQILLNSENYLQYTSQEGIQWVIDVHEDIISAGSTSGKGSRRTITICYQMTDGRQISRHYTIYEGTKAWDALQRLYNSPEVLLGYEDRESFFKAVSDVCIDGYSVAELCDTYERKYGKELNAATIQKELTRAIWADAEAGNLAQQFTSSTYKGYLEIHYYEKVDAYSYHKVINYFADASNILAWVEKYASWIAPK